MSDNNNDSRGIPVPTLLSLVIPSRRPHQISGLFDSIENTVDDPSCIEAVVKIDDDMPDALANIQEEIARRPFKIRFINTPRMGGQFTLWVAMDDLFAMCAPDAYFIMMVTDETRFLTKGWDNILRTYVGAFDDHVFRLRVSEHKYVQYSNFLSCSTKPECFPIMTRRWLELAEGLCNLCYAPDCFQQAIAFHLSLGRNSYNDLWQEEALFRDVPVRGLNFGGWEFGQDISPKEQAGREIYMYQQWLRLCTYPEQLKVAYLAKKIALYCWAVEQGHDNLRFYRSEIDHTLAVVNNDTRQVLRRVDYNPPRIPIYLTNIRIRILFARSKIYRFLYKILENAWDKSNNWDSELAPEYKKVELSAGKYFGRLMRSGFHVFPRGVVRSPLLSGLRNFAVVSTAPLGLSVILCEFLYFRGQGNVLKIVIANLEKRNGGRDLREKELPPVFPSLLRKCVENIKFDSVEMLYGAERKARILAEEFSPVKQGRRVKFELIRQFLVSPRSRALLCYRYLVGLFTVIVSNIWLALNLVHGAIKLLTHVSQLITSTVSINFLEPFRRMFTIPPAGLEKRRWYNPFDRTRRLKDAGYVVADYDELKGEMIRLENDRRKWKDMVFSKL